MARYIDADRLLMNFKTAGSVYVYGVSGVNAIISRINVQPTADVVEVKHGEWEVYYDEDCPQDSVWECSVCGYLRLLDECFPTNYCPNCGAKMDKEATDGKTGVDV